MDAKFDSSSLISCGETQFIIHHVHAFVNEQGEYGNPAGVVIIDGKKKFPLKNDTMIEIAQKVGYPETAFLQLQNGANSSFDVDVRFATPVSANGFCGHATVATFGFLINRRFLPNDTTYKMRTTVLPEDSSHPVLTIMSIRCSDNFIEMEQNLPIFHKVNDPQLLKEKVSKSLSLPLNAFENIEIVNTGGKDAIVSITEKRILDNVMLSDDICKMISEVSEDYHIVGYHLFPLDGVTYDKNSNSTSKISAIIKGVRNFAPLEGIPEEPATGSACGAMACFIVKNLIVPTQKELKEICSEEILRVNLVFEQGEVFGCPSNIYANVIYDMKQEEFISIKVSGRSKEIPTKCSDLMI